MKDRALSQLATLIRVLLGAWLLHLCVSLAMRSSSRLLVALSLIEGTAAILFMVGKTRRWGGILLLLSLAFAAGFHLRASEPAAPLWGYAAAVLLLTLAPARMRRPSPLAAAEQEFLRAFEANRIAPANFHHRDHIRAAWAVLCQYPLAEALHRYRAALLRIAARAGKPGIYHETITWAYLLLIHERLAEVSPAIAKGREAAGLAGPTGVEGLHFAEFAARNPDLLTWRPSILDAYYSKEVLGSEHARRVFVLPGGPAASPALS